MKFILKVALSAATTMAGGEVRGAFAQSVDSDPYERYRELTIDCAGSAAFDEEVLDCIGRATDACAEDVAGEEGGSSSDRYANCLRAETEGWRWMMESEIEPAFRQAAYWNSVFQLADGYLQNKFRTEQEAWTRFRDLSCELAGDLRAPPSMGLGEEAFLECMSRMNAERYVVLMNLHNTQ